MATHPVVQSLGSVTQFGAAPIASSDRTTFTQTYATAGATVAAATTSLLTNSTTGATATTTLAAGVGVEKLHLWVNFAGLSNADVVTTYTPGFKFKILGVSMGVQKAATTAAKACTLTTYINATPVTGGVLALTSANMTPKGVVLAGTSVTAANTGTSSDTITITGSSTAFVEGDGWIILTIQNMDTADAVAGLLTQVNAAAQDILLRTQNINAIVDAAQLQGIAL